MGGYRFWSKWNVLTIAVGLALRFAIGAALTYTYDVHSWALTISNFEAGQGLYGVAGYNYTPPWGYFLGTFSHLAELVGISDFGTRATEFLPVEDYPYFLSAFVPSLEFVLAFKAMLFAFDLAAGYVLFRLVGDRTDDGGKASKAFALWFLFPSVIVVSAVGGMFDSISVILTMLCIMFMFRGRYFLAGGLFALAVSTKLFPAILVFLLVAYVLRRETDVRDAAVNIGQAVVGAGIILIVVFLPSVIQGDLGSSLSFLTSRASSSMGSGLGDIERYGTILAFVAIAVVAVILARGFRKEVSGDVDGRLLSVAMATLAVLFLYPPTPQYTLLLLPFLIYAAVAVDRAYLFPLVLLAVGSTVFVCYLNVMDLMTLSYYAGIPVPSDLAELVSDIDPNGPGIHLYDILYYSGALVQYAGIVSALAVYLKRDGSVGRVFHVDKSV
ncbi:MAG: DUF2029 domain-containing protein [Candidatus Methanomethylophilaceae archaeon]|nr:DUF2029 domain-containing protein [Candidatus Methanomethylophilaceae archaeon]